MSTAYAVDSDSDGPDINSPVLVGDLSDQETSEVLDPASRVPFIIKKASVRTQAADAKQAVSDSNPWAVKRLVIDAAIGPEGIDGDGKYANKHLFPELILTFNNADLPERFASEWWQKRSRGPTKQFLVALGYDVANLPAIDADFLMELGGKEFVADIRKRPIQEKTDETNDQGKAIYRDTGDFKNELSNFRASA